MTGSVKQEIFTIDDLVRARAAGETAHEPIVAYPSSGTDYVYYTPHQVRDICHPSTITKIINERKGEYTRRISGCLLFKDNSAKTFLQ